MLRTILLVMLTLSTVAQAETPDEANGQQLRDEMKRLNEEMKHVQEEARRAGAEARKQAMEAQKQVVEAQKQVLEAQKLATQSMQYARRQKEQFGNAKAAFESAKAQLLREYVDQLSEDDLYQGAVAGMLTMAAGRKWDALLSPSEMGNLHSEVAGQFSGIGVEFDTDDKHSTVTVIVPFPGSPAEKAGIKPGDRVIKVDGALVRDDMMAAIHAIRGKPGTPVTLTILRDDELMTKKIVRAPITVKAVEDTMLPGNVGLVWLRNFNEKTPQQLREALSRVAAQKPRGLVIDVRCNQGGLVDAMVEAAGELLPKGATVATVIKRGRHEEPMKTTSDPVLSGVPVIVLVDGDTASGAEIFAAALRDAVGAKLVGAHTVGKFNMQKLTELGNGFSMKYTVGLFKTPKGQLLDGKGLDPDLPVDEEERDIVRAHEQHDVGERVRSDSQLRAALTLLNR